MEPRVLAYDAQGGGPPVVLVPGGLTGWLSWIPLQDQLSRDYRAIRVQPIHNELGSAGQPGDPGYTTFTERESLRLTLDELNLDTAHFAGWSGGGRALLEFAMEYPHRVQTMTLIEPAAYWVLEQIEEFGPQVEHLNEFLDGLAGKEITEDDLAKFLGLAGLRPKAADAKAHPNWDRWVPHRMALSWQSRSLGHPPRDIAELTRITCPVLLVRGAETDPWETLVVGTLAELLPETHVLDLPGDHACHLENPAEFLAALTSHIRHD